MTVVNTTDRSAKAVELEDRRRRVAQLKLRRTPHKDIARALGISMDQVYRDVKAVKEAWREAYTQDWSEFVLEELASLDELEAALWRDYHGATDMRDRTGAAMAILRTKHRRAAMLGLDVSDRAELLRLLGREDEPITITLEVPA